MVLVRQRHRPRLSRLVYLSHLICFMKSLKLRDFGSPRAIPYFTGRK